MVRIHLTGSTTATTASSVPPTNDTSFEYILQHISDTDEAIVEVEYFYVFTGTIANVLTTPVGMGYRLRGDIGQIDDGPQRVIATAPTRTVVDAVTPRDAAIGFNHGTRFIIRKREMFLRDVQFTLEYLDGTVLAEPPLANSLGWALGLRITDTCH